MKKALVKSEVRGQKSEVSSFFHSKLGVGRLTLGVCFIFLLASVVCRPSSGFAGDIFVGSETFVVTNAATSTNTATAPTSGGSAMPWHPAGILANFRDSPTGAVLIVQHIRAGIVNRHVSTNTITLTNTLFTSGTGATNAIVWDPTGVYTVNPPNDSLRITTSSTNAEIILNQHIQR